MPQNPQSKKNRLHPTAWSRVPPATAVSPSPGLRDFHSAGPQRYRDGSLKISENPTAVAPIRGPQEAAAWTWYRRMMTALLSLCDNRSCCCRDRLTETLIIKLVLFHRKP